MFLTQERLITLLEYFPESGIFKWRMTGCGRRRVIAGSPPNKGNRYWRLTIDQEFWYLHRLAFLYMNGSVPAVVDHIDGDRGNNAWANLRASTHAENTKNITARGYYKSRNGKYVAQITTDYHGKAIGRFDTEEEARSAYLEEKAKQHKSWLTGRGKALIGGSCQ